MKTVVKLGGVNGSGKTTVARRLIKKYNLKARSYTLPSRKNTMIYTGEINGFGVVILGSYENECGGMDTISDKEDRLALIKNVVANYGQDIVFFEGLITGKTYGAIGKFSDDSTKAGMARWIYAFMDTPFDVAADRVLSRRMAAGNTKAFDPERTMRSTYDSCVRLESYLRGKAKSKRVKIKSKHTVHRIKHKHTPKQAVKKLLKKVEQVHAG